MKLYSPFVLGLPNGSGRMVTGLLGNVYCVSMFNALIKIHVGECFE